MTHTYKLDRIDVNILAALQQNGRITNVELSEIVNLSPSPCLMRVKKLQKAGYISGYTALIDVSKLGETLTVFTEFTLKKPWKRSTAALNVTWCLVVTTILRNL
jgi:DNA-binding Lrp family transcriptional regulator